MSQPAGRLYRSAAEDMICHCPHWPQAALNMMTRTSASDYAKSHIYMTAVDTGWINDEKPAAKAAADEKVRRELERELEGLRGRSHRFPQDP